MKPILLIVPKPGARLSTTGLVNEPFGLLLNSISHFTLQQTPPGQATIWRVLDLNALQHDHPDTPGAL